MKRLSYVLTFVSLLAPLSVGILSAIIGAQRTPPCMMPLCAHPCTITANAGHHVTYITGMMASVVASNVNIWFNKQPGSVAF